MSPNQLTARMLKLVQAYRDGKVSTEEVQNRVERDVQGFLQLKNNKLIDDVTYQSLLATVYEFEDIIEEISHNKFITKSN